MRNSLNDVYSIDILFIFWLSERRKPPVENQSLEPQYKTQFIQNIFPKYAKNSRKTVFWHHCFIR